MSTKSIIAVFAILSAFFTSIVVLSQNIFLLLTLIIVFIFFILLLNSKNLQMFLLAVMIVIFFFYPMQYLSFLNPIKILNPLTFCGVILSGLLFSNKVIGENYKFIDISYFVFILAGIIGLWDTQSKLGAINWLFYSFFTGFIVYKCIISLEYNFLEKIIDAFLICGFITFCYGMVEYFLNYSILLQLHMNRFTSLLGHPLVNAFVFGILFFFTLFRYACTNKKKYILLAICFAIAIVLTKSRGAWFCMLFVMGVYFLNKGMRFKHIVTLSLIIFLIFMTPVKNFILTRLTEPENFRHSSWDIRKESLILGATLIKEHPFVGIGLFNSSRFKKLSTYDEVLCNTSFENSYYELLIETGFLGFISYTAIIVYVLILLFKRRKYVNYLCLSVLFMALHSSTFNILNVYRFVHFIYWITVALALRIMFLSKKETHLIKGE